MTRFLVDAQLPRALARWLKAQGYEAEHVSDRGLAAATDQEIWRVADSIGAVIVTKDDDFARRRSFEMVGPSIVWVRLRNTRKTELLHWFGGALPRLIEALGRGESIIELI